MSHRDPKISRLLTTVIGCLLVIGSLVWYETNVGGQPIVGPERTVILEEISYATLWFVGAGLVLMFVGITQLFRKFAAEGNMPRHSTLIARLSWAIADRRSSIIFLLSSVGYGLVFGIVSGTLVFEPGIDFSKVYGVHVPSMAPVVCCGSFGQMPQLVAYLTENFAILIIPLNLALLFIVSWLVGLNAVTATKVYSITHGTITGRWAGSLGAFIGLFTACPTCAGFSLLTIVGLGGGAALPLALSSLQAVYIVATIPVLIAVPVLALRRLPDAVACTLTSGRRKYSHP